MKLAHDMSVPTPHELDQLVDLCGDLLCLCRGSRIAWINRAGADLLGHAAADLIGRPFTDLLHEDHRTRLRKGLDPLADPSCGAPLMLRAADGAWHTMRLSGRDLGDGAFAIAACALSGSIPAVDSLVRSVHRLEERTRELSRIARRNDLSAQVFQTASEGIMVLDSDLRITTVNPAFTQITGWLPSEVIGRKPPQLTQDGMDHQAGLLMYDTARTSGRWQGEQWNVRRDGERYAERVGISTIHDEEGELRQYVVVFSDITQRKLDEERIRKQANYDALTTLPNRALFLDRLAMAVSQGERNGQMVGLMFIDLDGFKLVNDTLGHDMGDLLLQEAGRRLSGCIRSGDTVARLGGDEFTILMPNLGTYQNAPLVAGRVLESLKKPFDLAGKEAFVSGSIGITVFPDDAGDAATMLKNADAAMYRAKELGKANFQFYTADMNAAVEERLAIKNGLLRAIELDELALHFQPKQDLNTGAITGVEALLRWNAADLGVVSPAKFIPVMEESGLMGRIGEWAIDAACRQYRSWTDRSMMAPRIAINLSVRQLRAPGFVEMVERILHRCGIGPEALEFEITEGMVAKDTKNAVALLNRLSDMGIRLSMDDFGTGTSSLSVIRIFPVDSIKIDRAFIADLGTDPDSAAITRTIISMGHSLRRRIIAEGVETKDQLDALRDMGCDEIQGYVLAPPLPAAELERVLMTLGNGQPPDSP
ncbi:hypothetical protein A6A05_05535 [Magnetospirillum moscoviense]|uniref:Diguanylate cyclase n=2 Tax=Magnetospirillum moscoviense TaxID=1437059 RepID=A0A178N1N9_9PROT|nr:hypothetical protein A6A05_05535 [Magnetospirillum moscoviense]